MKRCPVCLVAKVSANQRMCSTCRTGLTKYPDENPLMVTAYVTTGLADLEGMLANWALFETYLLERGLT